MTAKRIRHISHVRAGDRVTLTLHCTSIPAAETLFADIAAATADPQASAVLASKLDGDALPQKEAAR